MGNTDCLRTEKNEKIRFCVNNRKINAETIREFYQNFQRDKCIDSFCNDKIFSGLDTDSGYRQVKIDKVDKHKTASTSQYGLYRIICMSFELQNAPDTFQKQWATHFTYMGVNSLSCT